jgi:hypothetical protein
MNIPGKHTERITLALSQVAKKDELKKPIGEIVRDINRRSKAKLEYKQGPGSLIFEGTGPVEAVRQALKEVANEIGSKVSHPQSTTAATLTVCSNPSTSLSLPPFALTSSAVVVLKSRKSRSAPVRRSRFRSLSRTRMRIPSSRSTSKAMP